MKPQQVHASWRVSTADPENHVAATVALRARLASVRGQHILFSANQGAVFRLNDTAADIWQALDDGMPVEAILEAMVARGVDRHKADGYVDAALNEWERSGLIQPVPPASQAATLDCLSQIVVVAGLSARILYPRSVAFPASTVFRHLEADAAAQDVLLQLVDRGEHVHLFRDGIWVARCGPDEVPVMVKGQLLTEILQRNCYELALHAAALLYRGRALLLCGSPGAGKTTLSLALAHAGFGFAADDVTLLDPAGQGIGVAFAPAVKSGSWPVLSEYWRALANSPVYRRPDGRRVRFLLPEDYGPAGPHRIGWVILLRRKRSAEPSLRAIEPAEILDGLLNGAFAQKGELSSSAFDVLCEVIRSAQGFCLTYSKLGDAVDLLKAACR